MNMSHYIYPLLNLWTFKFLSYFFVLQSLLWWMSLYLTCARCKSFSSMVFPILRDNKNTSCQYLLSTGYNIIIISEETEKLTNLPKVTQPVRGRARVQTYLSSSNTVFSSSAVAAAACSVQLKPSGLFPACLSSCPQSVLRELILQPKTVFLNLFWLIKSSWIGTVIPACWD